MTSKPNRRHTPVARRAFSLVEIVVVVVIMGIIAAVVVPRFAGAAQEARASAAESSLAGVRSSIASFRSRQIISGGDPYPTLAELTTASVIASGDMPANPFNGLTSVQSVTQSQASSRSVINQNSFGWNYFVDNAADPPVSVFYLNSSETTTVPDGSGGFLEASDL